MNPLRRYWGQHWHWSPPVLFIYLTLVALAASGLLNLMLVDSALDINLHGSFFSIPWMDISIPFAGYCLFWSAFYLLLPVLIKRLMNWWMALVHALLSLSCLSVIAYAWAQFISMLNQPRRYYTATDIEAPDPGNIDGLLLFALVVQLLAPANLVWTLLKRPRL